METRRAEERVVMQETLPRGVELKESGGMGVVQTAPSGVTIRRVQVDRTSEVQRVMEKIARTKENLLEARRDAEDHEKLMAEASQAMVQALRQSELSEKKEKEAESMKVFALREEQRLEEERARKHAEAVRFENERASACAEKVVAERTLKHTQELARQHEIGAKHARELERAHEMVLAELEAKKSRLSETETEIEVIGEKFHIESKPIDIEVRVQPEPLPEIRRVSVPEELTKGMMRVRIAEEIPEKEKIHVEAEHARTTERRTETLERVHFEEPVRPAGPVEVVSHTETLTGVSPLPPVGTRPIETTKFPPPPVPPTHTSTTYQTEGTTTTYTTEKTVPITSGHTSPTTTRTTTTPPY